MNYKAIFISTLVTVLISMVILFVLMLFDIDRFSPPQTLMVTALWAVPGYMAAKNEMDGGALHGMLGGIFGGLLSCLVVYLISGTAWLPLVDGLSVRQYMMLLTLCGFWSAFGGIVTDIRRVSKARKAQRRRLAEVAAARGDQKA